MTYTNKNKIYNYIDKEEIIKRFEILGKALEKKNVNLEIYLFGSGLGMFHLGKRYRRSNDIDFQTAFNIYDEDLIDLMEALDIHEIGGIMGIPPLDEVEVVDEIKAGNLTVKIPSAEDFALTKLLSNRIKDADDLKNYPILDCCDISKLRAMLADYIKYIPFTNTGDYNFNRLDDFLSHRQKINHMAKEKDILDD